MAARKNIIKLAKKISGPVAMLITLDENAPEYKVLNCVVTDEMAEVALAMELRKPFPIETIAKRCGKPVDETQRPVNQLAEAGVCIFHSENGVDVYELPVFVPGVMEKMMNNRAQCEKHPEIPAGFEEYARLRGGLLSPKLPVGASPMRVIPIQSAIDGDSHSVPYEEVATILNKSTRFAVADCSCRTSRRLLGEGCGHLEKDMCLQLNAGAEYCIRTGRAREITREEAFEIIRKAACPAHIAVQGYIKLAAQGRYMEALELIKKENPFPAVCGRICPRSCESACTRGDVDEPVAVDEIKKFIADRELSRSDRFIPPKAHDYGKSIAVIGAGPAGLSCAYFLAVDGYRVTVFEKEQVLGGMLTLGIPSFRLERQIIEAEIDILRDLGVTFRTGVEVGRDLTLDDLRAQGFEAFYVAIGAQGGKTLGLAGEDAQGVMTGVDFLRSINLGKGQPLHGKVLVVGGGNVAIDVARAAVREQAQSVDMYCLESREEMPALDEEIEEAESEAITIHRFVWEGVSMTAGRDRRVYKPLDKASASLESFDRMPRQRPQHKALPKDSFQDGRCTFTEEQLRRETERCLGCGAVVLNQEMCIGCGQCTTKCKFDAIHLVKKYNVTYNTYEQIPLKMTPNMVKRVGKIAVRSVKDAITGKGK